jgi:uroporphyrinogen decarboxylase
LPLRVEHIIDTLNHKKTLPIPRGELFVGQDYLDNYFPEFDDDYGRQLQLAASRLGLSAIGIDLNKNAPHGHLTPGLCTRLEEYFTIGFINGPFSRLIDTEGFVKAMVSTKKKPDLLQILATSFLSDVRAIAAEARSQDLKALALADDIAGKNGLLFSPDYFFNALLPHYKAFADIAKTYGLFVFLHSDGDMRTILDPLISAGFDCIHPVDVQCGQNLYALAADYGDRVTFMGHVDILAWDAERVRYEVSAAERTFTSGGLILGSTGGISANIDENVLSALHPSH